MLARIRVLASGSSGNALFLAFGGTRLLIDAGVQTSLLVRALREIDERPDDLSAVLVTHEHGDHVASLADVRRLWPHVPVLATAGTARALERLPRDRTAARRLDVSAVPVGVPFRLGDVRVSLFAVRHDATEPAGFRFDWGDLSLAVATDLGVGGPDVAAMLGGCRVLVLESNHDVDMLRHGPYPGFLKRRIASDRGHLSNRQSADLLAAVAGPALEHVVLAHLSRTNNRPPLAIEVASEALDGASTARITAAAPFTPGPLLTFEVEPSGPLDLPTPEELAARAPDPRPASPHEARQLRLL